MQSHDMSQLRGELIQLLEKQVETLAQEASGEVSYPERLEYEARRARINQLYSEIYDLDSAA